MQVGATTLRPWEGGGGSSGPGGVSAPLGAYNFFGGGSVVGRPSATGSGGGGPSSGGAGPNFIVSPGGTVYPVPQGATGPQSPAFGTGLQFQGGAGGSGLDSRVTGFRFMDSQPNSPYQYPNGYGAYNNIGGQTVNPLTGRVIPNSDPLAHIPAQ